MLDRRVLENILKANGVGSSNSDEEIRSVLLSARWHDEDVNTALTILRENSKTHEKRVNTLHSVFRTDETLKPQTISSLLGIDMEVPIVDVPREIRGKQSMSIVQIFGVVFFSIVVAGGLVFWTMWKLQVGLFYPIAL